MSVIRFDTFNSFPRRRGREKEAAKNLLFHPAHEKVYTCLKFFISLRRFCCRYEPLSQCE
jgi:hypothetical protein